MGDKLSKEWNSMVSKIKQINKLIEIAEEDEKIDLKKSKETIEQGLDGRITENLLEVESFLREIIKEAKL
ncbi:MAG: hypothetical protein ACQEP3_02540 [Patescibacteria group bacterium]